MLSLLYSRRIPWGSIDVRSLPAVKLLVPGGAGAGAWPSGGQFLQVWSAPGHDEGVPVVILVLAAYRQLESFREKVLKHLRNQILRDALRDTGIDVESMRLHPVRARDLVWLYLPGEINQLKQGNVADIDYCPSTDIPL